MQKTDYGVRPQEDNKPENEHSNRSTKSNFSRKDVCNGDTLHLVAMSQAPTRTNLRPQNLRGQSQNTRRSNVVRMSSVTIPNNVSFGNLNNIMGEVFDSLSSLSRPQQSNTQGGGTSRRPVNTPPQQNRTPTTSTARPTTTTQSQTSNNQTTRPPEGGSRTGSEIFRRRRPTRRRQRRDVGRTETLRRDNVGVLSNNIRNTVRYFTQNRDELLKFCDLLDSNLKNETPENEEKKKACKRLKKKFLPVFEDLGRTTRQSIPMIRNLKIKKRGSVKTSSFKPSVDNLNLHIHANLEDMDGIPHRLETLQNRVNIGNFHNISGVGDRDGETTTTSGSITIVSRDDYSFPSMNQVRRQTSSSNNRPSTTPVGEEEDEGEEEGVPVNPTTQQPSGQQSTSVEGILGSVLNQLSGGGSSSTTSTSSGGGGSQGGGTQQGGGSGMMGLIRNALSGNRNVNDRRRRTVQQFGGMIESVRPIINNALSGNNQNSSLFSTMNQLNSQLGLNIKPKNQFDKILDVALKSINMGDYLSLVGGDWSSLEKTREPVRKYIVEDLLKNEISMRNRAILIEHFITAFEKKLTENKDFVRLIKERSKPGSDIVRGILEISRTHVDVFLNLIIDGYDKEKNELKIENFDRMFSLALKGYVLLFCGEMVDFLYHNCRTGLADVEKIVFVLSKELIEDSPDNFKKMFEQMSGRMTTEFVLRKYKEYKEVYPNRKWRRTPFRGILPERKEEEKKKEVKKETKVERKKEDWMKGLSEEEIEKILNTMEKDEKKEVVKHKEFSVAYSGEIKKKKEKDEKNKEEEEEQDELDELD